MKLASPILAAVLGLLAVSPIQAQRWNGPNPYYQGPYNSPFNRNYGPAYNRGYGPQYNPGYEDPRHVWVYGDGDPSAQGAFEDMGNGWWQETNSNAGFRYQEIRRTPAYVELLDPDRHLLVRLFNDHLMQRLQYGYGGWQAGYQGHWQ